VKKFAKYTLVFLVFAVAIFLLGPRPATDETIHFDVSNVGSDLDTYLSEDEKGIANLTPGAEKEIIWADLATKKKTPLALIYLHGFSATKMEIRPVPDNIAKSLGANLYYSRLSGHGVGGKGLAEATMNDWLNDLAQAVAIGERLGDKIVIVTTSTGGTLAILGTKFPNLMKNVAGLVLVSPNFALRSASIDLMNMPWGETLLPLVVGTERKFEPDNAEQRKWWTTTYPTQALFSMAALLRQVEAIDKSKISLPALFIYSKEDTTVRPDITDEVVKNWGGATSVMIVETPQDAANHVIAGDILKHIDVRDNNFPVVDEFDDPGNFQLSDLPADRFQCQAQIVGHRFAGQGQVKDHRPDQTFGRKGCVTPGNDRQQAGNLFTRSFAAQNQHPFACGIQFVQRHLQQALRNMGCLVHHLFERFFTETAHHKIGGRHHVVGRTIATGASNKIRRQQQADHLSAPIFHGLGQRGDAGNDTADELHLVTGPDDGLTSLKAAVILDLVQFREFIRLAPSTDSTVANGTVPAIGRY